MTVTSRRLSFLAIALFVAACGNDAIAPAGIATLGSDFAALFATGPGGDPVDAGTVDVTAVSFTADPFNP